MDVPKGTLDEELATLVPVLHMKPGGMRERIKDYLQPSTLQQDADGSWSSFLTWQKVTDGEITGLDLIVAQGRRQPQGGDLPQGTHTVVPRRRDPGRATCARTRRATWRRSCSATSARSRPSELKQKHFKGYSAGDVVGDDGLEYTYDQWLRGRDGVARIEVDAFGRPKQTAPARRPPAQTRATRW